MKSNVAVWVRVLLRIQFLPDSNVVVNPCDTVLDTIQLLKASVSRVITCDVALDRLQVLNELYVVSIVWLIDLMAFRVLSPLKTRVASCSTARDVLHSLPAFRDVSNP